MRRGKIRFRAALFEAALLLEASREQKVFNTTVENSVEKHRSIFVSDSAENGSAFCTAARAGTFVLQPLARTAPQPQNFLLSQA
jgi:hypothetical protein